MKRDGSKKFFVTFFFIVKLLYFHGLGNLSNYVIYCVYFYLTILGELNLLGSEIEHKSVT